MKILWLSMSNTNPEPIRGSLDSIKKDDWEIETCFYDKYEIGNISHVMLDYVNYFKSDVTLYISVAAGEHLQPPETFRALREKTKLVHLCFDASCPDWHPLLHTYQTQKCFDLTVNIDGCLNWPSQPHDLTTLAPIDDRPYNKIVDKIIPLGFCGGIGPQRQAVLAPLVMEGLVTIRSVVEQDYQAYREYDDYANFMLQCRMAINMSLCGSGRANQVKARVIESGLARCCLLDEFGSASELWFEPYIDYVPYENGAHAVEKVKFLMKRPEIAEEYASNLSEKVRELHSPTKFWAQVFKGLGFDINI